MKQRLKQELQGNIVGDELTFLPPGTCTDPIYPHPPKKSDSTEDPKTNSVDESE